MTQTQHTPGPRTVKAVHHWVIEVNRLKAVNAQLLEALDELATLGNEGMKPDPKEWITFHDKVAQIAKAAIKAATE